MAKFFKEESYDLTQVHQALGYDSKAEYRHNRNLPTSHAIRRLGAEWIHRQPPKGILKEVKIPINYGEQLKTAGFWQDNIKPNLEYGKYLGKHKYYVYKAGRKMDVPRIKLLKHDLSKFRPSEWRPYTAFWFGPKGVTGDTPNRVVQTRYGFSDPIVYGNFLIARDKHFQRNPHHFHKLNKPQDFNTKLEMVADWYSANRGIHEQISNRPFPTFRKWYMSRHNTLKVSPDVIMYIDNYLNTK